jgi:hypothetical protein
MKRLLLAGSCLLALAAPCVAHAQSGTRDKPVKRAPTELWRAFPLQETKPRLVESGVLGASIARTQPPLSDALPEPNAPMSEPLSRTVVTAAMLLMLAVAAIALVIFNPVANRAGRNAEAGASRRSFGAPLRRARLQLLPDAGRRRLDPAPGPPPAPAWAPAPQQQQQQDVEQPAPAERPAVEAAATETCRIRWQRLYVSSVFVAAAASAAKTVAVSPSFHWWRGTAPRVTAASDRALAALVVNLREQGWTHTGAGREWFELEFARPATARPAAIGPYCTIQWERFYVTARFAAHLVDPAGGRRRVATSPDFRWLHGRPPTETARTKEALASLVEKLQRAGYEPSGRGSDWFALHLTRPPEPATSPGRNRPAPTRDG